jgi:hypothetical protein
VRNLLTNSARFFGRALAAEKAPWFLALFFAALGWTVVRSTDKLSSLPLVEFQIREDFSTDGAPAQAVRLRNITNAARFQCFVLSVVPIGDSILRFNVDKPHSVVVRGAVLTRVSRVALEADAAQFSIRDFSPGADVEIAFSASRVGPAGIFVSPCPSSNAGDKVTDPVLVPRSLTSLLVEHESAVLWSGLAVWLILMTLGFGASQCRSTP